MTGDQRLHFLYRRLFLSPGTPLRIAVQAAFDQRANRPEEWGQGADAYGKRVLSRWGRSASRTGIETATAAALGYEQRYIRCNCDGVMRRTGHALAMTFVTYDRNGHWVPNVPRVGSTIAASFIARSWTPHESYTAGQNARSVTLPLLTASLVNVWREFSAPVTRRVKKKFKID